MAERFVSYLRVSTDRQGESGLGLEAQREAVVRLAEREGWVQVTEFIEIMSGKRSDRPKLREAIATARKYRATLVIAKLDRLGGKTSHVLHLLDNAGIDFRFVEMPHASKLETRRSRTVDWATALRPDLLTIRSQGAVTLGAIAACLNERGIPARRDGEWQPVHVRRLLDKLGGA